MRYKTRTSRSPIIFSIGLITVLHCLLAATAESFTPITVETDFEGGNAQVLEISDDTNTLRITPELREGDRWDCHFYWKVSGYRTDLPLTIQIVTSMSYFAPVLAGYSYDQAHWDRIEGSTQPGYREFSDLFPGEPLYFAVGYPYLFSDVLAHMEDMSNRPDAEVLDLTTSEHGRVVPLVRITSSDTPDSSKFLIWATARQHAFECQSNYVVEGLLDFFTADSPKAQRLRDQAILYIAPMMDVDKVAEGGTGKDQDPVDFNRDWDSPSHWNAVQAVKDSMAETSQENAFTLFIDSHDPWPGEANPEDGIFFYNSYESGEKSNNLDFFNDVFESIGGYPIGRRLLYPTVGQTAQEYVDSLYTGVDLCLSLETGWVVRTDDSVWTIPRYLRNGEVLGETISDFIHNIPKPGDILIDNNDSTVVTVTGEWVSSTNVSGFYGTDYLHDDNSGKGAKSVSFQPDIPAEGDYEIFLRWTSDPGRADNVPVRIEHATGITDTVANMKIMGAGWVSLGCFPFAAGRTGQVILRNAGTDEYVIADAVRLSPSMSPVAVPFEDAGSGEMPRSASLVQNYPNPFNPSTTIAFEIPALQGGRSRVSLAIHDLRGRIVRTLVDGDLPPGSHSVRWDGRDKRGEPVASGAYLYRLKAAGETVIRKMTVLK